MNRKVDWDLHVEAQKKSGLSISEYCSMHGISAGTWYSRNSELKRSRAKFTPVTIKPKVEKRDLSISIEWSADGRLNFSGSTSDPSVLQYLIGRSQ